MNETTISSTDAMSPRDRLSVGDSVGAIYVVVESNDQKLRYRSRNWLLLAMVPLSVAAVAWNALYWLFIVALSPRMGRALRECGLTMPMSGFITIIWLGRSFDFDGRTGLISSRRLFLFESTIAAADIDAVVVKTAAGAAEASDKVRIELINGSAATLLVINDEFADGTVWNRLVPLVVQLGRVLAKPIRLEGEPRRLSTEGRRMLEATATVGVAS